MGQPSSLFKSVEHKPREKVSNGLTSQIKVFGRGLGENLPTERFHPAVGDKRKSHRRFAPSATRKADLKMFVSSPNFFNTEPSFGVEGECCDGTIAHSEDRHVVL
jgi:hypothetical protein